MKSVIKRILGTIPVLIGVVLLIFIMLRIVPGNAAAMLLGEHVDQATIDRLTEVMGLDKPVIVRFFDYLAGAIHGDLGISYKYNRAVTDMIIEAFPYTLELALLAALRPGTETRFTGAARLRDKESDRLASVSAALTALGGRVRQEPEGLTVWGVERLSGGEANSCGDHRIAMLCACAAPFCTGPVVLRNAGCTAKSYPGFWADYRRLGGQFEVL